MNLWLFHAHRQNAELAKLRQDCVHLSQELNERTAAQQAEEERRKTLETKMAAAEEQLAQTKVGHTDCQAPKTESTILCFRFNLNFGLLHKILNGCSGVNCSFN